MKTFQFATQPEAIALIQGIQYVNDSAVTVQRGPVYINERWQVDVSDADESGEDEKSANDLFRRICTPHISPGVQQLGPQKIYDLAEKVRNLKDIDHTTGDHSSGRVTLDQVEYVWTIHSKTTEANRLMTLMTADEELLYGRFSVVNRQAP